MLSNRDLSCTANAFCDMKGEGHGAERETSFEFHRQRFCYNENVHMFEKLKFPTRVGTSL